MPGFPRPFATEDADDETFDEYDEFRPDHLPEPGPFLDGTDVLTGDEHCSFHRLTREIFEERGVYDATFGYNLARLNLDSRHPDAGWRYARRPDDAGDGASDDADRPDDARESDDADVLLAEFTPTTEFCPQSDSLTVGAFRAWNALSDRHGYDRVSVSVAPMHHQSTEINDKLRRLEARLRDDEEDLAEYDRMDEADQRSGDIHRSGDDGPAAPF
ncbi:hypothetical protein [Halorussus aquaticus]|uniref:DUF7998 domain-containing protein n=1 Tax=Halorussus aquaticus TaxID=2953748 RepID=A0ABD5Q673_9EURY|nr:hypothetical protein [Halorussus aquaticus]